MSTNPVPLSPEIIASTKTQREEATSEATTLAIFEDNNESLTKSGVSLRQLKFLEVYADTFDLSQAAKAAGTRILKDESKGEFNRWVSGNTAFRRQLDSINDAAFKAIELRGVRLAEKLEEDIAYAREMMKGEDGFKWLTPLAQLYKVVAGLQPKQEKVTVAAKGVQIVIND